MGSTTNLAISFIFTILLFSEYYFISWQALTVTDFNMYNRTDDYWVRVSCYESEKGGKKPNTNRNCWFGEEEYCTFDNPCAPCDAQGMTLYQRDFLGNFPNTTLEMWSLKNKFKFLGLCRTCKAFGSGMISSNCNFTEGVGPYCKIPIFTSFGSYSSYEWVTKPCEKCCTDLTVIPTTSGEFEMDALTYYDVPMAPPAINIFPTETTHIVSVTLSFNFIGVSQFSTLFKVYYTINSEEDPNPYLQNGFWYDSSDKPVITQNGDVTVKALGFLFYKGKMHKGASVLSKTYTIVSCEQDLYFVYMSSSYVDPTWTGGLATDALASQYVFSHDDTRNPALLLSDSNTTTTGVGTYSVTTQGESSQYIAVSFPSYVRVSRVRLAPLHIDRWDANDLNERELQFSREPCVDSSGMLQSTGWEHFTTIQNITDNDNNLTDYVLNSTMANISMSCWRVLSSSGFVGLGSFEFNSTCA